MMLDLTHRELIVLYKNIQKADVNIDEQVIIIDLVAKMEKLLKEKPNDK